MAALALATTIALLSAACSSGTSGVVSGTPAGTYQITITGTGGSVTETTTISLQVQ
jgi:hypothetical protein